MTQKINITSEEEVVLDPEHLQFTEATLNEYIQKAPVWYSYYSQKLTRAQYVCSMVEDSYDQIYAEKFKFFKAEGGSDKLAESSAKTSPEVVDALKKVRKSKENHGYINSFVKSLDKSIQNAINLGYNVRKEMDKLGSNYIKSIDDIIN